MVSSDTFTFMPVGDVCEVVTQSCFSRNREKLDNLLDFIFKTYGPVALVAETVNISEYTYIIGSQYNDCRIERLLRVLGNFELGWMIEDNILISPRPSKLSPNRVAEAIKMAQFCSTC